MGLPRQGSLSVLGATVAGSSFAIMWLYLLRNRQATLEAKVSRCSRPPNTMSKSTEEGSREDENVGRIAGQADGEDGAGGEAAGPPDNPGRDDGRPASRGSEALPGPPDSSLGPPEGDRASSPREGDDAARVEAPGRPPPPAAREVAAHATVTTAREASNASRGRDWGDRAEPGEALDVKPRDDKSGKALAEAALVPRPPPAAATPVEGPPEGAAALPATPGGAVHALRPALTAAAGPMWEASSESDLALGDVATGGMEMDGLSQMSLGSAGGIELDFPCADTQDSQAEDSRDAESSLAQLGASPEASLSVSLHGSRGDNNVSIPLFSTFGPLTSQGSGPLAAHSSALNSPAASGGVVGNGTGSAPAGASPPAISPGGASPAAASPASASRRHGRPPINRPSHVSSGAESDQLPPPTPRFSSGGGTHSGPFGSSPFRPDPFGDSDAFSFQGGTADERSIRNIARLSGDRSPNLPDLLRAPSGSSIPPDLPRAPSGSSALPIATRGSSEASGRADRQPGSLGAQATHGAGGPSRSLRVPRVPTEFSTSLPSSQELEARLALKLDVMAGPSADLTYVTEEETTQVTLGRAASSAVRLQDAEVSGAHALIRWVTAERCWKVCDVGSLNGSLVNGVTISVGKGRRGWEVRLSTDDILQLGSVTKVKVSIFPRDLLDPKDRYGSLPLGSLPRSLTMPKNRFPPLHGASPTPEASSPSKKVLLSARGASLGFEVGVASRVGKEHFLKSTPCEDVALAAFPLEGGGPGCEARSAAPPSELALFGVFDGHCGRAAAVNASRVLPEQLAARLLTGAPAAALAGGRADTLALKEAFLEADRKISADEGCTATLVLAWRDAGGSVRVQAANVGDSSAILVDPASGVHDELTEDHRLSNPRERARLASMGIQLSKGSNRLYGLNLCRGLGDKFLKDQDLGMSAEPFVSAPRAVDPDRGAILILASDGLWDVADFGDVAREAVRTGAESGGSALEVAKAVLTLAIERRTKDDVTVVVGRFAPADADADVDADPDHGYRAGSPKGSPFSLLTL